MVGWLGISGIVIACLVAVCLIACAISSDVRRAFRKLGHFTRSFVGVDIGARGILFMMTISALPAGGVATLRSSRPDGKFDWVTFFIVFILVTLVGFLTNLLRASPGSNRIFGPIAGRVWLQQRKVRTSAILTEINLSIDRKPLSATAALKIVRDLLDVIVLHVRDYLGSHNLKAPDVFSNLLIESNGQLVVIARDSSAGTSRFPRSVPVWYDKENMCCARAMTEKKPKSVGDLKVEFPDGPQNKPYRSILAIPLIGSDSNVLGALSIDSPRPYFFQGFVPDSRESSIEMSLQPYLQTLLIVLEALLSRDRAKLLEILTQHQ